MVEGPGRKGLLRWMICAAKRCIKGQGEPWCYTALLITSCPISTNVRKPGDTRGGAYERLSQGGGRLYVCSPSH